MATSRRKDNWASLVPAGVMAAGGGPQGGTAYDRTQQAAPDAAPAGPPPDAGGGDPSAAQAAPAGILANAGAQGAPIADAAASTDNMTGAQLAALDQGAAQTTPDELAFQQLTTALNDPNTPPAMKQQIEQTIALEARKQMLGGQ